MKTFIELFEEAEEFDQKKLLPLAMKWLKTKFPEDEYGFTFKHTPNVTNTTKTYSVTVDGKEFDIEGRIFDMNGNDKEDKGDVVQFKINPTEEEPEDEETTPAFGSSKPSKKNNKE